MDATGEFDWLAEHIVFTTTWSRTFGPISISLAIRRWLSSRPKHDLVDSGDDEGMRPTISSQAGFYAANRPSTRVSQPMGGLWRQA